MASDATSDGLTDTQRLGSVLMPGDVHTTVPSASGTSATRSTTAPRPTDSSSSSLGAGAELVVSSGDATGVHRPPPGSLKAPGASRPTRSADRSGRA